MAPTRGWMLVQLSCLERAKTSEEGNCHLWHHGLDTAMQDAIASERVVGAIFDALIDEANARFELE